jgi:putative flavoprotein involved in K+ transport
MGLERSDVPVIIGAGPTGMSVGFALTRAGVRPKLLDRGPHVAHSWSNHYDTLRLNSPRLLSSLPGMTIDPGAGRFPSRVDMMLYLDRYARRWDLDIEYNVDAQRIERDGDGWRIETSRGALWAPQVVVATGMYSTPEIPPWQGRQSFTKPLLHVRDYRNGHGVAGKRVLVVGGGQSSADVAMEAVAVGASQVWLSVRTPPHLAPPTVFGISPTVFASVIKRFGNTAEPVVNSVNGALQRYIRWRYYGDIEQYGFGRPPLGLATSMRTTGRGILIDRGLITALRSGQIERVEAVVELDHDKVVLADSSRLDPDVVICGTGSRPNLEPLVGHLGVLEANGRPVTLGAARNRNAPGLYFIGFRLPPGSLPDTRRDGPAIARRIVGRRWRRPVRSWRTSWSGYPADRTQTDLTKNGEIVGKH